jgi:hypothetical protein
MLPRWQEQAKQWASRAISQLNKVFVSEKELYNFRDAPTSSSYKVGWNMDVCGLINVLDARITKLNAYDDNIRNNFKVSLEVVMRDKIIQTGNNGKIQTKN